ncbi:2-phosphosulfolactate phosphatase [Rhodococcus sp. 27YEA15]|uniref:2-phosphosulfolactate phosphatase n=1 Tax=Rhodococcus sp. 27YEA15 TaxID=3156259 RepID=UPI003C7ACC7D
MNPQHQQRAYGLRFDWGVSGARAVAPDSDVAVVVDVLSFTTTLTVAADEGIDVLPYERYDETAVAYARESGAALAVRRSVAAAGQISLSPGTIRRASNPGRLVLPSPNGSTISFLLSSMAPICVGASLRNSRSAAEWIVREHGSRCTVAVLASGEKWPGGELRPAVEDLWGAGAVVAGLLGAGWAGEVSPEARMAADAWSAVSDDVGERLRECSSGRELTAMGYPDDVAVASELGTSESVPVLEGRVFRVRRGDTVSAFGPAHSER